uniref:MutS-related protein n=1 Tax=Acetatifactor sp. TaxID=1872090 RepID=UPI004055FC5E
MSKISLLYPADYDRTSERTMKDFKFIQSLRIDDMVVLIKESFRGFTDLALENFFTTSPEVLRYRLAIVEDLVENKDLYEVFCKAVSVILNISDMRRALSSDFSVESALSCVRYLEMYQEIVNLFAESLKECEVHSEGMKAFKEEIISIAESKDYKNLCEELSKMDTNFGLLKSVTIGVNLDENLRPKEAGIVAVNQTPFRAGTIIDKLLKKTESDNMCMMSPFYPMKRGFHTEDLKNLNSSLQASLQTIFAKSLRSFEPAIHNYYNANTAMFISMLDDIRFLTAGVGFILSMKEKGYPMCKPTVAGMEEKKCELEQVYNPMLVRNSVEETIVSNSFAFDEKGRFYIVTGPNHGGKSIFAYSVGMAQALFQLGLYVPAESAIMSPVSSIYTHFPSSDENNYGKGRLESECARLSEIMKELSETDMLLMDESFSSTSGLEAGYIASEVLTGIGVIGCCGIFVTHIHDLPQQVDKYNAHPMNKGKIDNLVALMENKESGKRSYKVCRTTPDGLSYAKDIAKRYGLNLEGILGKEM